MGGLEGSQQKSCSKSFNPNSTTRGEGKKNDKRHERSVNEDFLSVFHEERRFYFIFIFLNLKMNS